MAKVRMGTVLGALSGKTGNAVFATMPDGSTVMRQRVAPCYAPTSAQVGVQDRIRAAGRAFSALDDEQYDLWVDYARHVAQMRGNRESNYDVKPVNIFISLSAKVLQVNPDATIPTTPPTFDFTGDGISVRVSLGSGGILFTASGANAQDVVTELLVQPLRTRRTSARPRGFRSQAFVAFSLGRLSHLVALEPGYYACAARFVHAPSGQCSSLMQLSTVTV